jgi:hypothetical protein
LQNESNYIGVSDGLAACPYSAWSGCPKTPPVLAENLYTDLIHLIAELKNGDRISVSSGFYQRPRHERTGQRQQYTEENGITVLSKYGDFGKRHHACKRPSFQRMLAEQRLKYGAIPRRRSSIPAILASSPPLSHVAVLQLCRSAPSQRASLPPASALNRGR